MNGKTLFNGLILFPILIPSIVISGKIPGKSSRQYLDLGGRWQFSTVEKNSEITRKLHQKSFSDFVVLPGTLDENKKGTLNKEFTDGHLNRVYRYTGLALFQKEIRIPESWKDRQIDLILERTKVTRVWLDARYLGTRNTLFSKQVYGLGNGISAGTHTLTILVDNTESHVPVAGSHAYSEDTQTNWNGIIGQFRLEASNPSRLESVRVYPELHAKRIKVTIQISNPQNSLKKAEIRLSAESWNTRNPQSPDVKKIPIDLTTSDSTLEFIYSLGDHAQLWSEFDPALYTLSVSLNADNRVLDQLSVDFGMREFKTLGTQFTVNGIKTFLRGRHDACVFPLTGYPPMDTETWMRWFRTVKSYGLNHVRFHTWCPPEAAFKAASVSGVYLQPELPIWWSFQGNDPAQVAFMMKEGTFILDNYGNYPSFAMFALGNEVYQDRSDMKKMVDALRKYDDRHLYAQGSNNFGGNPSPAAGDDYWTTFRTALERPDCGSDVRASISFVDSKEGGILNTLSPSTSHHYSKAIADSPIPVIGHEIGQYQIYPDFREISKYTGILKPSNLEFFKKRLEEKGMGDQAGDFFKASGALSVICYRADIETAIRTPGFGGFQLLDLQDYPGQGTALVGILDAFMDSKGLITPAEFRQFCDETVILLIMDKYCWTNNETFDAEIQTANYGPSALAGKTIHWSMISALDDKVIGTGKIPNGDIAQGGLTSCGKIHCGLDRIRKAQKVLIHISLHGSTLKTAYPIWVYPAIQNVEAPPTIKQATELNDEIMKQLADGNDILLFPEFRSVEKKSVPGTFIPEFWNYAMFTGFARQNNRGFSPGTMGILTRPSLSLFNDFPTEFHADWQWWSILKNSRPLILDGTKKNYRPLVQVIDNINRNYKLGLIFEFRVGKGKLLVCAADLPAIADKPEARQLHSSLLKYMSSKNFNPSEEISPDELMQLLY
jgi:hypothetical protein